MLAGRVWHSGNASQSAARCPTCQYLASWKCEKETFVTFRFFPVHCEISRPALAFIPLLVRIIKMELSGSACCFVLLTRLALFLFLVWPSAHVDVFVVDTRLILLSRRADGSHYSLQNVFRHLRRLLCSRTQQAILSPPHRRPDYPPSRRKSLIHVAFSPPLFFFLIRSNLRPLYWRQDGETL